LSISGLFWIFQLAYAADITDNYAKGDTLTATKLDNVKSAVNSKQDRVTGVCPPRQAIGAINADGTVICEAGADTLGALSCDIDKFAKWDGSAWVCSNTISDRRSLTGVETWYNIIEHIRNPGTTPVASIRTMSYDKKFADSLLKITYTDNLRSYNYTNTTSAAACLFHLYVNGEPCTVPNRIVGAVYTANSVMTNPHQIRTMVGVCSATASGPLLVGSHQISVYVADYYSDRDTGCYLGWSSTTTLLVEELP
jgi:hypothetical protein